MDHPFSDNLVETVTDRYQTRSDTDDKRSSQEKAQAVEKIQSQLSTVQSTIETHLTTLLANIHSPQTGEQVTILDETPDRYYFEDNAGVFWPYLNRCIDELDEVVRYVHQRTVQAETDAGIDDSDLYVIAKPVRWREAEWLIETYFIALADRGLSGSQALDYFMTRKRGLRTGEWADSRGITAEGIRQNAKNAEDTLGISQSESVMTDVPPYFERVYRGESDGRKKKVTADYGRLDPRQDVDRVNQFGHFNWGKTSKRSTQLSIALLVDALGRDEAEYYHDEFSSVVAEFDSEWELKASEIRDWAAHLSDSGKTSIETDEL